MKHNHQTWFQWWQAQRANHLRHLCSPKAGLQSNSTDDHNIWANTIFNETINSTSVGNTIF